MEEIENEEEETTKKGSKKKLTKEKCVSRNNFYLSQLEDFAKFASNKWISAIFKYVKAKCLIQDLIRSKILRVSIDNTLEEYKEKDNDKAFLEKPIEKNGVRFIIDSEDYHGDISTDRDIWKAWIDYVNSTYSSKNICMVSGKETAICYHHGRYLITARDQTKLLSCNDDKNFTYRGRFRTQEEAYSVGAEISSKFDSAVRWLIDRQGYVNENLAIVCFSSSNEKIPSISDFDKELVVEGNLIPTENTAICYAQSVRLSLLGYKKKLTPVDSIILVGFNSMTEKGRKALVLYREYEVAEYFRFLENWFTSLAFEYGDLTSKNKYLTKHFIKTPSPNEIIKTCYPETISNKQFNFVYYRLLQTIINESPIPNDILKNAIRVVSNKEGIINRKTDKSKQEEEKHVQKRNVIEDKWSELLSTTCALYRKNNPKENYQMALEEQRTTRDYLYGRLLAVADVIERDFLAAREEKRETNATRLFSLFANKPNSTWLILRQKINPYIIGMGKSSIYYEKLFGQIIDMFDPNDYMNNGPLSGEFLLGYYHQVKSHYTKKEEEKI